MVFEQAVAPLDLVRGPLLRLATRSRLLTRVLSRRETRIAALGMAQVLLLLALTVRWPLAMYFIGPVMLGVAHLAADVRYLALRLPLPRALLLASLALAALVVIVRVVTAVAAKGGAEAERIEVVVGASWIAIALLLRARPSWPRVAPAIPVFGAVVAVLVRYAPSVDLALLHVHNLAAFVLWFALYRRRPGWAALPVVVALLGAAVLLSGVTHSWTAHHGGVMAFGERASRLAAACAPGVNPRLAMGITTTFIFLQSTHYAVWTGWIAQDCLPGEGTPTFRMTVRSLLADFGPVALAAIVVLIVGFAAAAVGHMRQSVHVYMTLARAHVWFELAVFAFLAGRADVVVRPHPRAVATTPVAQSTPDRSRLALDSRPRSEVRAARGLQSPPSCIA